MVLQEKLEFLFDKYNEVQTNELYCFCPEDPVFLYVQKINQYNDSKHNE